MQMIMLPPCRWWYACLGLPTPALDIIHLKVLLTCFPMCYLLLCNRDAVSLRSHNLFVDMPVGVKFVFNGFG